jgi:hypothetical protein
VNEGSTIGVWTLQAALVLPDSVAALAAPDRACAQAVEGVSAGREASYLFFGRV